jgi:hypothetical protein
MKQYLVLLALALVIWWLFFRKPENTLGCPIKKLNEYFTDNNSFCESTYAECNQFVDEHVSFEGGPEAFKNLHDHIHSNYNNIVAGLFERKDVFKPDDMKKYVSAINEVPTMYVNEMSEMYKKYTIPESVRTKHMNMINSQHERRMQKDNKWYKIMEPFIKK